MTRAAASPITNNFTVFLNGYEYAHTGILALNECAEFTIDPLTIQQQLDFVPLINGSKTGFIRLIYQDPLLWSDDVSIGIKSVSSDRYECDFRVISPAAPDHKVSLTPFGKNIIAINEGVPVSCKGNYTAWVFNKIDFPGTYNITITEE